jgi:hypothetical protein
MFTDRKYPPPRDGFDFCASTILAGGLLSFISELLAFLRARKIYWLGPALVMLVLGLLLLLDAGSLISPSFRYFE